MSPPPQLFRTRTHLCVIQHPQLIQLFFRCHSAGPDVVAHDLPLTSSQNLKRSSEPGVLEVVSWRWGDAARSCEPSPSIQLTLRSPTQSVFPPPRAKLRERRAKKKERKKNCGHGGDINTARSAARLHERQQKCLEMHAWRNTHVRIKTRLVLFDSYWRAFPRKRHMPCAPREDATPVDKLRMKSRSQEGCFKEDTILANKHTEPHTYELQTNSNKYFHIHYMILQRLSKF